MPSLVLTVADGNDDTWFDEYGAWCRRNRTTGRIGYWVPALQHAGFRFLNVPLDRRHKITRARLSLKALNTGTEIINCRLGCEAADNAGNFIAQCNPAVHPMTKAYGLQTSTVTVQGERFYTVDLAAALQEVLDRAGWVAGNALVVLAVQQTAAGGAVDFYQFDHDGATSAPQLEIDYTFRGFIGGVI